MVWTPRREPKPTKSITIGVTMNRTRAAMCVRHTTAARRQIVTVQEYQSPIFITAERADAQNQEGIAVYTINARGWQDDNFVKGDLNRAGMIKRSEWSLFGNVESALTRPRTRRRQVT